MAPRLRATGVPCIASPEIKSSSNTQQHGTETTALLMLADYIGLMLHRDSRPSGTHSAAGQYVHSLMNMTGPRSHELRGSGRTTKWNSIAQGHRRGHGLDTRCAPMRTDLPESWHNTPGQYIECTCKLTTNISTMTDNIITFNQINAKARVTSHSMKPICAPSVIDSLTRWLPRNQAVTILGSQLKTNRS